MKKWNNPELMMLGLENTNDDAEAYKNDKDNVHFCHAINDWHSTEDCTHNHGGGACKDPTHGWSEEHKSSCCCGGLS